MIVSRDHARRLIAAHYPGWKFRITAARDTIGVRAVTDPRPTLVWRSLVRGEDSAVRIGILRSDNTVDWQADISMPPVVEKPLETDSDHMDERLRTVDTEPGVEEYRR
jgi:hypothetical protein